MQGVQGIGTGVLLQVQRLVAERLGNAPSTALVDVQSYFTAILERLVALLTAGIVAGTSQSAIVVGPRGCGKSSLLRRALAAVQANKAASTRGFRLVECSALVQTARALREALLAGDRATSQCLVVVLDEIDLYAHSSQQLLLYTLLDLVQSGNAPLVVIGLTCRLDVTSLFEKRVLSRFSRQQVHLQHTWDFAGYASAFAKLLRLPDEDKDSAKDTAPRASVREQWNTSVEAVVDNASVRRELEQLFFTSRGNLRLLQQVAMSACTAVGPDEPFLEAAHVYDGRIAQCADARVSLLLSASGLELSLVIAYSQLLHRGASSANFEQIFDTYRAFTRRIQHDGGLDLYQKPVALKAFEHLCSMELFRPADGRNYPVTDPYRAMQLMLTPPQLAEVLEKCSTLPTKVKVWAKSGGTEMN
ncbi:uncharacterized protein MONBRDRAFT_21200 [Monosiga brevicollis MX1]|uniref:Origin recognition complex subunit 4 n=1 Tax=Monosiga brevicollis TaxID=81824 RepID=A9URG7_MONBE|nr:uncharacterized protein MONBRDRAFT_21200 [Monosiga brevicollis MX1]EDQ92241.1 predicted protein [Monosiga brevicollis MX1]|eukprot:XP_001743527.1 hypothetical protein [Monosiga brevicollis MX1]